jgi:hypothetical protein
MTQDDEPRPNTSAEVVLKFGDRKILFALKGKHIQHLEKDLNRPEVPPGENAFQSIANRLFAGRAYSLDIRMTIHRAMEGGGMPPVEVADVMERYFDSQPVAKLDDPASPMKTAQAIMHAAWFGWDEFEEGNREPGEARAGEGPAPDTQADSSPTSPPPSSPTAETPATSTDIPSTKSEASLRPSNGEAPRTPNPSTPMSWLRPARPSLRPPLLIHL